MKTIYIKYSGELDEASLPEVIDFCNGQLGSCQLQEIQVVDFKWLKVMMVDNVANNNMRNSTEAYIQGFVAASLLSFNGGLEWAN